MSGIQGHEEPGGHKNRLERLRHELDRRRRGFPESCLELDAKLDRAEKYIERGDELFPHPWADGFFVHATTFMNEVQETLKGMPPDLA